MAHAPPRSIEEILRSTLLKLEQTADLPQDDPALIELKRHIIRAIADLEREKEERSSSPELDPVPRRLTGAA